MCPYPKWLQNRHFWRGISALCCAKNDIFHRLSGKWPTLEALFSITYVLACIFKQIFIFSVLILPLFLGSSVARHCHPRLHSGSNFHISALGSVTHPEKLCLMSFASRIHFRFSFHVSALDMSYTCRHPGAPPPLLGRNSRQTPMGSLLRCCLRLGVADFEVHAFFHFARLHLFPEHELKGGGVPSPEGLQ